jgi:hypothetical protein
MNYNSLNRHAREIKSSKHFIELENSKGLMQFFRKQHIRK